MAAVEAEQEVKRRKLEGADDGEAEAAEVKEEKEPELAKELEGDAKAEKGAKLASPIQFELKDSTLNVIPTLGGRVLMPLSDGGLQYLMAGARANTGFKKGRYLFEVKIVEFLSPTEPAGGPPRNVPMPRQLLKVGVATKDCSLFLGETEASACFDSEGFFTADKKREAKGQRLGRDQTVGILLNLDKSSPNANTISLFRDGVRVSAPEPLPEAMQGKPLFPVVNFRNMSVQVNFGPVALAPLPFTCLTMQEGLKDDAVQDGAATAKDGKYEVLFPVGIPDEGTFEWVDAFLAKNPHYSELSDRAIIKWAEQSGMTRPVTNTWKNSSDKPDMNFSIPMMDDFSVRRVLNSVVATQPRNYVVMEVKSNLIPAERAELMKRFSFPHYKKVAEVVMGEPTPDFKAKVQEALLGEKQEQAEREWRNRKAEKEKRRLLEIQQRRLEEARKRAEAELQKRAEELQKAAEVEQKAAEAALRAADGIGEEQKNAAEAAREGEAAEKKDEEMKEEPTEGAAPAESKEEKTEEAAKAEDGVKQEVKEEDEEEKPPQEEDEPMPVAVLTDEDRARWFRKKAVPDLTSWVLATQFAKFALPGSEEGFAEIRYPWTAETASQEYFRAWVLKHKILCRMEELQPGDWFKARWTEWQKVLSEWHQKQADWRDPMKEAARLAEEESRRRFAEEKVAAEKAAAEKAAADKAAAEKAAAEGEKKEGEEGGEKPAEAPPAEGEAAGEKPAEEKPAEEKPAEAPKDEAMEEAAKEEAPPKKVVVDDIFAVENVSDVGTGEPLFSNFAFEDWALLSLRLELYLLVHAFKKDAGDPERVGIHESHLPFYYNKYYRKTFQVKYYGVETTVQLVEMVKDSVKVAPETGVLTTEQPEEVPFDLFVKLTEEGRRQRQHSLDAGDETVKLKFSKPPEAPQAYQGGYKGGARIGGGFGALRGATVPPPHAQQQWYGGGKGGGYGKTSVVGGGFDKGSGYTSSSYGSTSASADPTWSLGGGATVPPPAQQQWYSNSKGGGSYGKSPVVGGGFDKGGYAAPYGGGRNVCKQWQAGSCRYGAQCRFAHS